MVEPQAGADTSLAPFGYGELHSVVFQHKRDSGGCCNAVAVDVPKDVARQQIEAAMAWARANRARVMFVCDTSAQAQQMLPQTARLLPNHRRVALERAAAGGFGLH